MRSHWRARVAAGAASDEAGSARQRRRRVAAGRRAVAALDHVGDESVAALLQAGRVACAQLAERGDVAPLDRMRRKHEGLLGQREQPPGQAVEEQARIGLAVARAATADVEGIAAEQPIAPQVAQAARRVPGVLSTLTTSLPNTRRVPCVARRVST